VIRFVPSARPARRALAFAHRALGARRSPRRQPRRRTVRVVIARALGGRRSRCDHQADRFGAARGQELLSRSIQRAALVGTGTILGAGLALLFAPKAGHEIRHDIAEKVGEIGEHLRAQAPPPTAPANGPSA
jgi:hypothetical protein